MSIMNGEMDVMSFMCHDEGLQNDICLTHSLLGIASFEGGRLCGSCQVLRLLLAHIPLALSFRYGRGPQGNKKSRRYMKAAGKHKLHLESYGLSSTSPSSTSIAITGLKTTL